MLDNIREWISDNLRYILLVIAAIILIIIAVFAFRIVGGIGSSKKTVKETEAVVVEQDEDSQSAEVQADADNGDNDLVKDQSDVLELVTKYYEARSSRDYDTLKELCESFTDDIQAEIESQDAAVESFNNIMTYSKPGLEDGSYVVYVYFDAKLSGIETQAPSLRELYLITDEEGNLIVSDKDADANQKAYTEKLREDDDVQALIADVNKELADAEDADEALKDFIESGTTPEASDSSDEENTADAGGSSASGTMTATAGVNVRDTPSTDGNILGALYEGMEVTVLDTENAGWAHVQYTVDGVSYEGYVSTDYLS